MSAFLSCLYSDIYMSAIPLYSFILVLGIEHRASHMPSTCYITVPYLNPTLFPRMEATAHYSPVSRSSPFSGNGCIIHM